MSAGMTAQLVTDALVMAIWRTGQAQCTERLLVIPIPFAHQGWD
jgi:transposase InsO family protein